MILPCGCCEGTEVLTPVSTANRWPGELPAGIPAGQVPSRLTYRVGTHATFLETMLARLSSADLPELAGLKTRELWDPGVALLDAWAVVGDVLTFYQERIVSEGYLRTATERRSVLELSRLVGYTLKPGVSASVYLAYTLEKGAAPVEIPPGTRASSVPEPGEQLETFETADALEAKVAWNELRPRLTEPQTASSVVEKGLFVSGAVTSLKANDPILVRRYGTFELRRVREVAVDHENKLTTILLHRLPSDDASTSDPDAAPEDDEEGPEDPEEGPEDDEEGPESTPEWGGFAGVVKSLTLPPSLQPPNAQQLERDVTKALAKKADARPKLLASLEPRLQGSFYATLRNLPAEADVSIEAHALRVSAAPFGHNAPLRLTAVSGGVPVFHEWKLNDPWNETSGVIIGVAPASMTAVDYHTPNSLYLDNDYDLQQGTWIAIEKSGAAPIIVEPGRATLVRRSLAAYGLSGKTVQIKLPDHLRWVLSDDDFTPVRSTRIYAGSERLTLGDVPITEPVKGATIELADVYEDLDPGRWLIVTGERSDILDANGDPVKGVRAAELVMLAAVEQKTRLGSWSKSYNGPRPVEGDTIHTFITLAEPLAYEYERSSVRIFGNVVRATHGETRKEVLGSGKAATRLQQFALKQPPLTYVSAPTASGVETTLEIRVNQVAWHEVDSLAALGPNDRSYVTRADDDANTTVVFGDGAHGARLPTGVENVKATYRTGIGERGNVKAGQISLPTDKPLGVKEVINPIRASGGANKEDRDDARKNIPLPLHALDRLVSVQDYESFARTYAGVGKASAARLSDGSTQLVHVTIAGAGDAPVEPTSDLFRNLGLSLRRFGDPNLPIRLGLRRRLALVLSAKVKVAADFAWEHVEPQVRAALLERFGFKHVELGQDLHLADAIAVIQAVPGVDYVDVDVFDTLSEQQLIKGFDAAPDEPGLVLRLLDRITVWGARRTSGGITPAEIAYIASDVPETLILQELKS
ncbi:putative baseplate assembly protein [Sorangium sp. So ce131]|uniref:putative baseplate assembly protein n=1 Tax=Sorangium sp. So ce131 TaxID=3133282 RepID=UPI003F5D7DB8